MPASTTLRRLVSTHPIIACGTLAAVDAVEVRAAQRRLEATGGGYEIVHESAGLEGGGYVLVAPEPDRQQPHEEDEVYFVLDGRGTLDVAGEPVPLAEGQAAFVPAH